MQKELPMRWMTRPWPSCFYFMVLASLGTGCGQRADPPKAGSATAVQPAKVAAASVATPLFKPLTDVDAPYVAGSIRLPTQGTFHLTAEYRGRTAQGKPEHNLIGTEVAVGGQQVDVGQAGPATAGWATTKRWAASTTTYV